MEKGKHYFYILLCKDGSFYAGYTNNLSKRLKTHNEGKGAKYTRARLPVKMIYYQPFETKQEAMRAEYRFKQLVRKEKEAFLRKEIGDSNVATEKL